jgi:hypothetical protein
MKTPFAFAASLLLAAASSSALAQTPSIDIPPGTALLLQAKGDGVQIYACADGHWELKAPDARLLDAQGRVIGKHFAGPTWHLNNGGEVKGKAIAKQPAPDGSSAPWLLVQAVSSSGSLASVTYIRRTNTHGGAAPGTACTSGELRVPYTATYEFYTGGK